MNTLNHETCRRAVKHKIFSHVHRQPALRWGRLCPIRSLCQQNLRQQAFRHFLRCIHSRTLTSSWWKPFWSKAIFACTASINILQRATYFNPPHKKQTLGRRTNSSLQASASNVTFSFCSKGHKATYTGAVLIAADFGRQRKGFYYSQTLASNAVQ